MKSQRRHELQENALATELGQMKEFFARYGNWVLTGLAVVVFIFLAVWYWHTRSQTSAANEWATYENLKNNRTMLEKERDPQLVELINTSKNPAIAAGAALLHAEDLTDRYAFFLSEPQLLRSAPELKTTALQYYQLVIDRYSDMKPFVARAYLGIGKLAENDGEFAKARENYQQVLSLVNNAYSTAAEAQRRLQHVGSLVPSTASAPSSQPAEDAVDNWAVPVKFATTAPVSATALVPPAAAASAPAASAPAAKAPAVKAPPKK